MAMSTNIVSCAANEFVGWWSVQDIGVVVDIPLDGEWADSGPILDWSL
jgi:hypothetical protein